MIKKISYIFSVIFIISVSGIASVSYAQNGSGADFSVEPVYPANQQNGEVGYFNLKVKNKESQTIKVKIYNYSEDENTIHIRSTRATTSDGGVISYKEFAKEKNNSIIHDFEEIVSVQQDTIRIPGNSSKEIEVDIKMPDNSFDGEILGGLHFYKENKDTEANRDKTVINTFSYSIPIVLKESSKKVNHSLEILAANASQRNYHNYVETTLQNSTSSIINSMSIEGQITKKGLTKALYTKNESNYKMAPNSTMKFGFDLNDTPLKAGIYLVKLKIDADDESFNLEKEFEISKEEARKLNKESVYLEENNNLELIITACVLISIVLLLSLVLILKNRKNNE